MKKVIGIAVLVLSGIFATEAQAQRVYVDLSISKDRGQGQYKQRNRRYVRYETNYRRIYGVLYKETYRVDYLRNGRIKFTLVGRERVYRRY